VAVVALVVVAGIVYALFSRSVPDSALTAKAQGRIATDPALQNQAITANALNGVITLTGTVTDPALEELATNDANVKGARKVINDLTVTPPNAAATAPQAYNAPPPSYASAPPPMAYRGENASPAPVERRHPAAASTMQQEAPPVPTPSVAQTTAPAVQQQASAPPPPPQPTVYTIPAGTRVRIQTAQQLSSKDNHTGDTFTGTLAYPIQVNGQTVVPTGAPITGEVTQCKKGGHFKGASILALQLDSINVNGHSYQVRTANLEDVQQGKGKRTAETTGGGAALGALIGGLAGGGKGALLGGLFGAGAGATGGALTGNKQIVVPAESVLTFRLNQDLTIKP
jgi:hypothetical protein